MHGKRELKYYVSKERSKQGHFLNKNEAILLHEKKIHDKKCIEEMENNKEPCRGNLNVNPYLKKDPRTRC